MKTNFILLALAMLAQSAFSQTAKPVLVVLNKAGATMSIIDCGE